MGYPSDMAAKMQQLMSEQRAKLETAYDADPKVKSAKDALEQAKDHLASEKHIQSNLDRGTDWHRWNASQQNSVRLQMSDRVFTAEQAVQEQEKLVGTAIGAHIRESQQAESATAQKERERLGKEEQTRFAAQEEEKAKAQFRSSYLAAGGNEGQYEAAWPGVWAQMLAQRATGSHDAMTQKLISSGRYNVTL